MTRTLILSAAILMAVASTASAQTAGGNGRGGNGGGSGDNGCVVGCTSTTPLAFRSVDPTHATTVPPRRVVEASCDETVYRLAGETTNFVSCIERVSGN
ncbi:MAG: hypothetical protein KDI98_07170 [Hyphomicrobiaceae bacterium]|nr:hypothetical protein [Hyphomicrobiaceae bacterium]